MKLALFSATYYDSGEPKFEAGKYYPITLETSRLIATGSAEEVTVSIDADRAQKLAEKANAAADKATASAKAAAADLDASTEAARIAKEAQDAVDQSIASELNKPAPAEVNTDPGYADIDRLSQPNGFATAFTAVADSASATTAEA